MADQLKPPGYSEAVVTARAIVSAIASRLGNQDYLATQLSDGEREAYEMAIEILQSQMNAVAKML